MRSGGTLYWLLSDHLGGTAHTLSGATETGEVRYKAFGATRFTSGTTPTSYRFTGQREEAALGLYYYNARWYDPTLGHFVAAGQHGAGRGQCAGLPSLCVCAV
jgi:RHS repeat-associated protein